MLDVHPPHHAAQGWKDFFIHIATIVVGLLIAIGLEQTVEYFHHRDQLHQLQEDLHEECIRNLNITLSNIKVSELRRSAGAALYAELLKPAPERRSIDPPAGNSMRYVKPAYAVWTVAQQSGTLGLMPREQAQRFVRVYSLVQQAADVLELQNSIRDKLREAIMPGGADLFGPGAWRMLPRSLDAWAALDPEDFRQARNALGADIQGSDFAIDRNVFLYGLEWAVLHESSSDEQNIRIMYDASVVYHTGGTPALLAKYPLLKAAAAAQPEP